MRGVIYDTLSGRIEKTIDCPENIANEQLTAGESMLVLPSHYPDGIDDTHYVESGVLVEKLPSAIQVKTYGLVATLIGIPINSLVVSEGGECVSDGDLTEIEFDAPGTYEIRIYPPPQYRDEVLEVTVG